MTGKWICKTHDDDLTIDYTAVFSQDGCTGNVDVNGDIHGHNEYTIKGHTLTGNGETAEVNEAGTEFRDRDGFTVCNKE